VSASSGGSINIAGDANVYANDQKIDVASTPGTATLTATNGSVNIGGNVDLRAASVVLFSGAEGSADATGGNARMKALAKGLSPLVAPQAS
jgi:hypothetical protein